MADKRMFNSKLNGKGLEATVSEEAAKVMAENQGKRYLFLVQAHVGPKVVNEDGSQQVTLISDIAEVVPAEHEKPIQEFLNALIRERPSADGTPSVPWGEGTPSVADTAAGLPVWDGNPDTEGGAVPNDVDCDYPGCTLASEHDGEHAVPGEEEDSTVVAFSGKKG